MVKLTSFCAKNVLASEGHLNYLTNYKLMSLMTEGKAILSNWLKLLSFGYLSLANNKIKMAVDTLKKVLILSTQKKLMNRWTMEVICNFYDRYKDQAGAELWQTLLYSAPTWLAEALTTVIVEFTLLSHWWVGGGSNRNLSTWRKNWTMHGKKGSFIDSL